MERKLTNKTKLCSTFTMLTLQKHLKVMEKAKLPRSIMMMKEDLNGNKTAVAMIKKTRRKRSQTKKQKKKRAI